MKEEIFRLNNISFKYQDGTLALKNVSMKIYRDEILGIIGPNGAGKSTLLMVLDGLLFPYEGNLYAFGEELNKSRLKDDSFRYKFRKRVGIVFQDPDVQLFSSTVWDDIAFGLKYLNIDKEEIGERVDYALRELKISYLAKKHPYNLSVGEKKKASIATILPIYPEVILLDEPTANLDPGGKKELLELIKRLNYNGITFVIATHDLNFIAEIADRIYVLNKSIIAEGSPIEILSNRELMEENNLEVPLIIKYLKQVEDRAKLIY